MMFLSSSKITDKLLRRVFSCFLFAAVFIPAAPSFSESQAVYETEIINPNAGKQQKETQKTDNNSSTIYNNYNYYYPPYNSEVIYIKSVPQYSRSFSAGGITYKETGNYSLDSHAYDYRGHGYDFGFNGSYYNNRGGFYGGGYYYNNGKKYFQTPWTPVHPAPPPPPPNPPQNNGSGFSAGVKASIKY